MDDERFYELIRLVIKHAGAAIAEVRKFGNDRSYDAELFVGLADQVEHELAAREIAAVVNRENARLALRGPG